jgi:hypothetical protein
LNIINKDAKVTPKKVSQFVTFWKRNKNDEFDFYIVNIRAKNTFRQFVFPKAVLIQTGITSTGKREGKRAFRVYPKWDVPNNK